VEVKSKKGDLSNEAITRVFEFRETLYNSTEGGKQVKLANKVAIVTGGSRGIGRSIAQVFAREGATVVIVNRTPDAGKAIAEEITNSGGNAVSIPTDVSKIKEVERMVHAVIERYKQINILCNNAGIGLLQSVVDTTEEEWDRVIDINLKGVFLCCKYVIPGMIKNHGGYIINIGSTACYIGSPNDAAYCASKGGLLMLTKQTALDYASYNIHINCICPGFITTWELEHYLNQHDDPEARRKEIEALHPIGRLGTPEDIAHAALYLASDESSFVTGASLVVDGGSLIKP